MPNQLHHVVMRSHSAETLISFFTDVVGMQIQFQLRVPGHVLEQTLGWPPCDGADLTMLGSGDAGLVEVLAVPTQLRDVVTEGLAGLSFLTEDSRAVREKANAFADDVTAIDTGMPGVDLFFCTMGGVPIEFMGSYAPEANSEISEATNS
ncbi:MAG TPA: VOC family protein [Mycobacterium sp.]|jgi:catechol 2,3-dioxygenase-like lactoylglutathione lyase family enzyme|nr:VOC family protein [Mycobacterium sp.]